MSSAGEAQLAASDPRASVFVSAHAGTGKTKVLVDRLVRLMLEGADPARILCLTYTKAAAAEMAIRLQQRLGRWVTMDDAALEAELALLEVAPEKRQRARELFAHVLDLPGGMRIGTIHAFCQSLLKRFPLEAQISPHFQVAEEMEKRADLEEAREQVLPGANVDALARLAGLVNAEGFAGLASVLEAERARLEIAFGLSPDALETAIRRVAGVASADEDSVLEACVAWPGEGALCGALRIAEAQGSDGVREKAARMLGWLALTADLRAEHFGEWRCEFLLDSGEPRGLGVFANKKLAEKHPQIIPLCEAEQSRLLAVLDEQRAHRMAAATAALLCVAGPILAKFAEGKERRALLDYADLITRSFRLLADEAIGAAWVLFKLDGGLDHLLLDEVQDTAPEQWEIADRLTADFFVGEGAREGASLARTVFAVGDRKQSIYSFQGADPEEFDRWRAVYERRVTAAGLTWRRGELSTSFRSSEPVLRLVDAVFADPAAAEGVCEAGAAPLRHVAHREGQAGRVELWPLAPRPAKPAHTPWMVPKNNQSEISAPQTLVNELARWIAEQTAGGTVLHSERRALRPGDILVLVRRRSSFASALVRALKARGVAVAGLDRMVLTEQPAVQDVLSLCEALLLPQDDLSLAEMLVSPLGGLSDESLMDLAMGRQGSLWEALRARAGERAEWAAAHGFFAALLGRVDYAAPHALLVEALGKLGGRARLFARLGPEAAEPLDELLNAALQHASVHPPSLQGFVHWLRLSAAEVKREAEAAGNSVRVMTVHGSKGLEAPVVILPDTTSLPPDERGLGWALDEETGAHLPLWQPNRELRCSAADQLRQAQAQKRAREYNRLLYVALTRARDRLVICGWEVGKAQPGTWYEKVERGMLSLEAEAQDFGAWPGQMTVIETRQIARVEATGAEEGGPVPALPAWAGRAPSWSPEPLAPEPVLPRPLAPSRPDGVALGPVPPSRSPLVARGARDRFARGLAMHALLQHLPDLPEAAWEAAARAYAARPAFGLEAPEEVARQALGVMRAPELAALFGPGSRAEQPISGVVGSLVVTGQVDRLAVLADRVLIADYKTRAPPEPGAAVPVLYLRQMAAYRAVLALLYPDRPVHCVLIWTDGPEITVLADDVLDRHAAGAASVAEPA
jgi:ATP-dependent helicase/nuclease subunit A